VLAVLMFPVPPIKRTFMTGSVASRAEYFIPRFGLFFNMTRKDEDGRGRAAGSSSTGRGPTRNTGSFMAKKSSGPLGVGIIGCGNISNAYFKHVQPFSDYIRIVACADLNLEARAGQGPGARPEAGQFRRGSFGRSAVRHRAEPHRSRRASGVNRQALRAGKQCLLREALRADVPGRRRDPEGKAPGENCASAARRTPCWAAASRPAAS